MSSAPLFENLAARDAAGGLSRAVTRAGIAIGSIALALGLASAYRAWVQVYALEVRAPSGPLAPGATVRVDATTSGRTPVDVRLELTRGEVVSVLESWRVRDNGDAALDPRPRHATFEATLTAEALRDFGSGSAILRAVATGRPQWLRLPPPTVRAATCMIAEASRP